MKLFHWGLILVLGVTGARATETFVHLADPARVLASESKWLNTCEERLADFERATGIRMRVEFHLKSPSEEEDKKPGAYMQALSRKLGIDRGGVLLVYFNDEPDWRVWIGDDLVNSFTGKPGTVQELTANETIHNVKEALLAAAEAKAAGEIARIEKDSSAGKPMALASRLVIQLNTLLAALQTRLTSK